jgi:putative acetyltransferase
MALGDYPEVLALWRETPGIGLSESDSAPELARFLAKNPDLSSVAVLPDASIVGAVLCGHDGRRGALYHLAVLPEYRGHGVGGALVTRSVELLAHAGIAKCNVFLFRDNLSGAEFWRHAAWIEREDLAVFQKVTGRELPPLIPVDPSRTC